MSKPRTKKYRPKIPSRIPWWSTATPMTQSHKDQIETEVRIAMSQIAKGDGTLDEIVLLMIELKLARQFTDDMEDGDRLDDALQAGQQALLRITERIQRGETRQLNADLMAAGKAVDLAIGITEHFTRWEIMNVLRAQMRERGIEEKFNKQEVELWIKSRLKKSLTIRPTTRA